MPTLPNMCTLALAPKQAFGHAPEADIAEEDESEAGEGEGEAGSAGTRGGCADTRDALQQWERSASEKLCQEEAAAAEREAAAAQAEAARLAAAHAAAEHAERAQRAHVAAAEEIQEAGYSTPPTYPGHTLTTVLASPPS